jgi:hypothetical protein
MNKRSIRPSSSINSLHRQRIVQKSHWLCESSPLLTYSWKNFQEALMVLLLTPSWISVQLRPSSSINSLHRQWNRLEVTLTLRVIPLLTYSWKNFHKTLNVPPTCLRQYLTRSRVDWKFSLLTLSVPFHVVGKGVCLYVLWPECERRD